ncbi:MAG: hypothetical protein ACYSWW_04565 [Planctomycetota bacterium]|jgi:hypothetical protein
MTSNNKVASRFERLRAENWRLTYRLDEDLRAKFNGEDRYVSHCKMEAAKERLKKTLRAQELGSRRIDRQLSHAEDELNRLSKCLESLREHVRHDGREYSGALNQALELLEAQNQAEK